jgi:hypothetical protein
MFLLIAYLLTSCSRVLLEKLTGFAASQEIPRIYEIRNVDQVGARTNISYTCVYVSMYVRTYVCMYVKTAIVTFRCAQIGLNYSCIP